MGFLYDFVILDHRVWTSFGCGRGVVYEDEYSLCLIEFATFAMKNSQIENVIVANSMVRMSTKQLLSLPNDLGPLHEPTNQF